MTPRGFRDRDAVHPATGDVVTIYHDPITRQRPECDARLVHRLRKGTVDRDEDGRLYRLDRWRVAFLEEERHGAPDTLHYRVVRADLFDSEKAGTE